MPDKQVIGIKGLDVLFSLQQCYDSLTHKRGLHHKMMELLIWYVERYGGDKLIITSMYRIGDKGVHGQVPCRGVDIRTRGVWEDPQRFVDEIYRVWEYGDGKHKVALFHDVGRGEHIHLQVRNETRRVEE